jgi:hypothetical protein
MNVIELKDLLNFILKNFIIRYEDFGKGEYHPYRERHIVGFIRFDQMEIFFDKDIRGKTEELTWAHEALSIYYYHILKIIRHDDEIENEARELCKDNIFCNILREYIHKAKRK